MNKDNWCIIIPYRNREEHLELFSSHYQKILPNVPIYVIEQANNNPFNLGKLINIGFIMKGWAYEYFCKHDVDMLARKNFFDYSMPKNPTHIATMCSQFKYRMPFHRYFGGVNLFTPEQFVDVNGFPNNLNGWGAEDDILRDSFIKKGYHIDSRKCIFDSLEHEKFKDTKSPDYINNVKIMKMGRDFSNGISSCRFSVLKIQKTNNYTKISVNFTND